MDYSMTSSLAANTTSLLSLLADQLLLCAQLEDALKFKQACLLKHQLDALQQASEQERGLALQIGRLEAQRLAVTNELAQDLALAPGASISGITAALGAGDAEACAALTALGAALASKLEILSQLNDDNRVLASSLLEYTGMVLRLLARGPGGESYSASGRLSDGQPRAMLDDRI
jgi:flagellar biosynthesis/type III secretory pathway chaperone